MKLQRKEHKPQKAFMFEVVSVSVASLIFAILLFVGFIALHRMILGQERSYYNISKNFLLVMILPKVLEK